MPLLDTTPVTRGQNALKETGSVSATLNLPAKQPVASTSALNWPPSTKPFTPASMSTAASSEPSGVEPFRPSENCSRAPKSMAPEDAYWTKTSLNVYVLSSASVADGASARSDHGLPPLNNSPASGIFSFGPLSEGMAVSATRPSTVTGGPAQTEIAIFWTRMPAPIERPGSGVLR